METLSESLKTIILREVDASTQSWFASIWPDSNSAFKVMAFRAAFAGMPRRLGVVLATLKLKEKKRFEVEGLLSFQNWPLSRWGQVALLVRALEVIPQKKALSFVRDLYHRGDNQEQASLLRSLVLLTEPQNFVELASEACRTHVVDVFEALACENSYPTRYFSESSFNQMVVKALFLGVSLKRVVGLPDRRTGELKRMVQAFASERQAAKRAVPDDVYLVLEQGALL